MKGLQAHLVFMQHHKLIKIVFCDQNRSLTGNQNHGSQSYAGVPLPYFLKIGSSVEIREDGI